MTKEQTLEIIKLLSAVESWSFSKGERLPDYLHDQLCSVMKVLTNAVLES
jgi:hypothetical protein